MQKVRELFSITERVSGFFQKKKEKRVHHDGWNKRCSLIMTYLCMFNETSAKVATELTASGYT
jgi:Uri superfamily endonuclease